MRIRVPGRSSPRRRSRPKRCRGRYAWERRQASKDVQTCSARETAQVQPPQPRLPTPPPGLRRSAIPAGGRGFGATSGRFRRPGFRGPKAHRDPRACRRGCGDRLTIVQARPCASAPTISRPAVARKRRDFSNRCPECKRLPGLSSRPHFYVRPRAGDRGTRHGCAPAARVLPRVRSACNRRSLRRYRRSGGWRWTSHSPTGSGPEGSSPNELRFGSLVNLLRGARPNSVHHRAGMPCREPPHPRAGAAAESRDQSFEGGGLAARVPRRRADERSRQRRPACRGRF